MIDEDLATSTKRPYKLKLVIIICTEIATILMLIVMARGEQDLHPLFVISLILSFLLSQSLIFSLPFRIDRIVQYATNAKSLPASGSRYVEDVMESISLAAGIKPPEVLYIDEDFRNAFSMKKRNNSHIFLTRGLINNLERDELESVIAHEIAHIKNGDASIPTLNIFPDYLLISSALHTLFSKMILTIALLAVLVFPLIIYLVFVGVSGTIFPLLFILVVGIEIPIYMLSWISSPKTAYDHKLEYDYIADEQSIRWTLNPDALTRALCKSEIKSQQKSLKSLHWITFLPIREENPYHYPHPGYKVELPSVNDRLVNIQRVTHKVQR